MREQIRVVEKIADGAARQDCGVNKEKTKRVLALCGGTPLLFGFPPH